MDARCLMSWILFHFKVATTAFVTFCYLKRAYKVQRFLITKTSRITLKLYDSSIKYTKISVSSVVSKKERLVSKQTNPQITNRKDFFYLSIILSKFHVKVRKEDIRWDDLPNLPHRGNHETSNINRIGVCWTDKQSTKGIKFTQKW